MDNFDVVVVGSGALGSSAAFHLAKAGKRVALVDKEEIASQTSPRAAGLSGQVRQTRLMMELAQRSVKKIERFVEETGEEMVFYQPGSMTVARTPEDQKLLEDRIAGGRDFGLDVALIEPDEAHALMPFLQTKGIRAVSHMRTDLFLEPVQLPRGYARAAERLGAVLMPQTRVTDIVVENGTVSRVLTDRGELATRIVVDAAGGWLRVVGEMADSDILAIPMRHQLMVTAPLPEVSNAQPITRIMDVNVYVRPDRGGLMLGGYERDPMAYDPRRKPTTFRIEDLALDIGVLRRLAATVEDQFPIFRTAPISEHRGGLPTMTADGQHLVGPLNGVGGFYILGGCNVGGLSISPALGEQIAQWIVDGAPSVDIAVMSPNRFAGRLSETELLERCTERYARYYTYRFDQPAGVV
jgi:glycine/D-amino acid oxidase-like deaminating enzyme